MKTNVWIMNHYASSMYFDKGGRHYAFAKYMRREGYNPVVFCCNSKHGNNQVYFDNDVLFTVKKEKDIDVPFVFVKGRPYTGNGKTRILNMVDFYFNVQRSAKIYAKKHGKPDVIYASSVHPLTLVAGIKLAKHFGVKCVCEIRDLWPESIAEYGIMKKNNIIIKSLRSLEKWIYVHADRIVFTMEGAYDYIKEQHWENEIPRDKVAYINNGIDLESFDYNKAHYCSDDYDLIDNSRIKVVYVGSIRKANQIDFLINIAKESKNSNIKFLIWGSGDEEQHLIDRINQEKIDNVVFKGRVEKKFVPYIVSKADYNFLDGKDSPLLRYGLSANKMFDYFASHKPTLTLVDSIYNPIVKESAGVVISNEVVRAAKEIDNLPKVSSYEYDVMCKNANVAAEEYSYKELTQDLIELLEQVE